jgi:acetoin utilization deacetylase AcuC-like enzyme
MTGITLRAAQPFTKGRTLSLLEGGYNLHALKNCVSGHIREITEFCAGLSAA